MMSSQLYRAHSRFVCPAVLGLFIVFLFAGCSATKGKTIKTENLTLRYLQKDQAGTAVAKIRLAHPIQISESEVKVHLLSLRYEELSLLGRRKYAFSPQDVHEVSRLLTKAMNHVSPENIIRFELSTPRGTTKAEVFASQNKIHWRLSSIKGQVFSNNSFPGIGGSNWRLVPKGGQRYHVTKKLLGNQTREDWIVANMALPKINRPGAGSISKPRKPPPPPRKTESQEKNLELEDKLKFLKEMHRKKLIDDEEYQRKRRELLDNYL